MSSELILHEYHTSGNCYKIRLTAALLNIPIAKLVEYNLLAGETRTPAYLTTINSAGTVPVLQIGSETYIRESGAAIAYLAHGSRLIPTERLEHAQMLQWMFFEQYNIEPNIGSLRFWLSRVGEANLTPLQRQLVPTKRDAAARALDVMEKHLVDREFFVGQALTLADVALFGYTHAAGEAGLDLGRWSLVSQWLDRVRVQQGYISLEG